MALQHAARLRLVRTSMVMTAFRYGHRQLRIIRPQVNLMKRFGCSETFTTSRRECRAVLVAATKMLVSAFTAFQPTVPSNEHLGFLLRRKPRCEL